MESLSLEEKNIFKYIINLLGLKKEIKGIEDRILRDINNLFELEKEEQNYYRPVRVNILWSNVDRNKMLSVEEYLNEIRPYFKNIINNFKKSDTRKLQLTITNNFFFFHR